MQLVEDYIRVYQIEDENNLKQNTRFLQKLNWDKHHWATYNRYRVESENKNELDSAWFQPNDNQNEKDYMYSIFQSALRFYLSDMLKEGFNFDINNLSNIKFNRYHENTNMDEHVDHIRSLFDGEAKGIPILSMVMALNDETEYEGGDFVFTGIDKRIRLKAGEVVIFPSVFPYKHTVEKVTKNTRYTAVVWAF